MAEGIIRSRPRIFDWSVSLCGPSLREFREKEERKLEGSSTRNNDRRMGKQVHTIPMPPSMLIHKSRSTTDPSEVVSH